MASFPVGYQSNSDDGGKAHGYGAKRKFRQEDNGSIHSFPLGVS